MTSPDAVVAHIDPARRVQVYNQDCLDFLKRVPSAFFDAAFIDPPSNIGADYGEAGVDDLPVEVYAEWVAGVMSQVRRCMSPLALVFSWTLDLYRPYWDRWFPQQRLVIEGLDSFCTRHLGEPERATDPVVLWTPSSASLPRFMPQQALPLVGDGLREPQFGHPCPRPQGSVAYLFSALQGRRKVLDLFSGSGTALVVGSHYGFDMYGCELDPGFFEGAVARLYQPRAR